MTSLRVSGVDRHIMCSFLPATVLVVLLDLLRSIVLVGVVLVCALVPDVVLVVHILGGFFGMAASFNSIVLVHSLGLSELVNFATNETSKELLGELVRDRLAYGWSEFEPAVKRHCTYLPCVDGPRRA